MSLPSLNIEIVVTYLRYDCEIISKSVSKNDFFDIVFCSRKSFHCGFWPTANACSPDLRSFSSIV